LEFQFKAAHSKTPAIAFSADPGDGLHKRTAETMVTKRRPDIQVIQPNARLPGIKLEKGEEI